MYEKSREYFGVNRAKLKAKYWSPTARRSAAGLRNSATSWVQLNSRNGAIRTGLCASTVLKSSCQWTEKREKRIPFCSGLGEEAVSPQTDSYRSADRGDVR